MGSRREPVSARAVLKTRTYAVSVGHLLKVFDAISFATFKRALVREVERTDLLSDHRVPQQMGKRLPGELEARKEMQKRAEDARLKAKEQKRRNWARCGSRPEPFEATRLLDAEMDAVGARSDASKLPAAVEPVPAPASPASGAASPPLRWRALYRAG